MKQAILDRLETGDEGTFGILRVLDETTGEVIYSCSSLELPWRGNRKGLSCIPAGGYIFRGRTDSPKHPGFVYEADPDDEAPDRTNIQIHAANLAGDETCGYVKQLDGCIAPCLSIVQFRAGAKPAGSKNQRGGSASKTALQQLVVALRKEPFHLTVKWADGVSPEEA